MIRNNLDLHSTVVIGLCSDPSCSKEEMSQFIKAGADSFWLEVQKDPRRCIKEILEKWLVRNVRLNPVEMKLNQVLEQIVTILDM